MKKSSFFTELAYLFGLISLCIGAAFMRRANWGLSMVIAPSYLFHLKFSEVIPWFTFGTAGYCVEALLLIILSLFFRRVKIIYLLSFVTAVIHGIILDICVYIINLLPAYGLVSNIAFYILGILFSGAGVSLIFHTYFAPEAYEMIVKEVSSHFHIEIHKVKLTYDYISCFFSIILSFLFFGLGHFEGIKLGTIIYALLNGHIIKFFSKFFEKHFTFRDAFAFRKYIE